METHSQNPSPEDAKAALNALSYDREKLAARVHIPWALLAAFGAVSAWWVATAGTTTPGEDYTPPTSSWLALAGALVVIHLIRSETGVRFRTMGVRASWALAGIIVSCLALFSAALGFVSFGLVWPVALMSLVAFATTTWLAGVAFRSARETLGHV